MSDDVTAEIAALINGEDEHETIIPDEPGGTADSDSGPEGEDLGIGEDAREAVQGESTDAQGPDEGGGDPGSAPASVGTLAEAAEKLGLEVKELYGLEVTLQDGVKATLGELKDAYQESGVIDRQEIEEERTQILLERQQKENDVLVAQQELANIVGLLGDQVNPQIVERARAARADYIRGEREKLLQVLPQWRDPEVLTHDRQKIGELLTSRGFSEAEIANVSDHRLLKLAKDFADITDRVRKAEDSLTTNRERATGRGPAAPINEKRSAAAKRAHKLKQAKEGGEQAKVAAVKDLLQG